MRIATMIPKTKRGKQLVKQHGERWEVVRRQPYVLFDANRGPWLLVQPLSEERAPADDLQAAKIESASRWVHEFFDENFQVAP